MWSLPGVAVVAVVGAIVLFLIGTAVGITVLRRRDRHLVQQQGLASNLSAYHRSRLSATENNYAHIPQPNAVLRRHSRSRSIPAIWNTLPSEEHIDPEAAPPYHPNAGEAPTNAKRRRSLRASVYAHSFQVLKARRQKKDENTISLKQMPRSPLSAITEFTDSTTEGHVLAELPTEHTPGGTPKKVDEPGPAVQGPFAVAKTSNNGLSGSDLQRSNSTNGRAPFVRSVSMGSTASNAPEDPLPPLPTFDIYKHHRSHGWRTSTTSLDTVNSSVLGTVMSSPSHVGTDITIPDVNTGLQTFDFGFNDGRASARLGVPPGRQVMQVHRPGKSNIASIIPSLDYNAIRVANADSAVQQDSFRTIDASSWNPSLDFGFRFGNRQTSMTTRHSLQDYASVLGKRSQYGNLMDHSGQKSPQSIPPRPASVASGNPYQWDLKPAFATARHSTSSTDSSRKGHRRQNCVRITNLPAVETRNSKIGQMPEVVEEQPDSPETPTITKGKIPGLSLLEAGQPVLRARASLVDIKGSPSPLQNHPILHPSRPKRPNYYHISTSASCLSRPDSDIFSTAQPSPTTLTIFKSTRQWPLSPTPSTNIKMNLNTPPPHNSPTLTSPINAGKPRKSLVKGPRNLPTSNRSSVTASPSPSSQSYAQKKTADDLRKSVMILRSMNSEGRLLDQNSRNYRNIGEDSSNYPTMNNLSLLPVDRRNPCNNLGPSRSKISMTISPSAMSVGAMSIWEDASVRGDSPEPEMPTPKPVEILQPQPRTPQMKVPYLDPKASENIFEQENYAKDRNKYTPTPQGKGLGLSVGGATLGTPASLYDHDGFLME